MGIGLDFPGPGPIPNEAGVIRSRVSSMLLALARGSFRSQQAPPASV